MDRIFVTGANGFVGLTLIKKLTSEGRDVFAFLYEGEDPQEFKDLNVPYGFGDIRRKETLSPFIHENDIVVHLAAIIAIDKRQEKNVMATNYEGTKNVLTVAQDKKARQFIYLSSVHAIPFHQGEITENDVFREWSKASSFYEKSKNKATRLVLKADSPYFKTTVIYPSGIVGPGDEKNGEMTTLIKQIATGKLFAYVSGGYNFIDVREVCEAIEKTISLQKEGGFLLPGKYLTIHDIVTIVNKGNAHRRMPLRLPRFLAWACLPMISFFQLFSHRKPLYTAYSLRITAIPPQFSCQKEKEELHLAEIPLEKSIREMAEPFQNEMCVGHRH